MKAIRIALSLVLAQPALARSEDLFDLLDPSAATSVEQATHFEPSVPVLLGPSVSTSEEEPPTFYFADVSEPIPTPIEPIGQAIDSGDADIAAALGAPARLSGQANRRSLSPLFRPIVSLTLDAGAGRELVAQGAGIPEQFAIKDPATDRFGDWNLPQSEASQTASRFGPNHFHFAAPAVYSRPLYFEQANLERYGHHVALCECDNLTQSALSAAHFFATVPVMPYKMGATHPDECSYVLGVYRPGSCNPHQLIRPELSARGLALEGAAVTGLIFLIP